MSCPPAGQGLSLEYVTPLAERRGSADQGLSLEYITPLAERRGPPGCIDLDSLPDVMLDRDSPLNMEEEYVLSLPGVRRLGRKRAHPDVGPYTAPSKLQAGSPWTPNHGLLPVVAKLEFPAAEKSIVQSNVGLCAKGKGKMTAEPKLMALEQVNDLDTCVRFCHDIRQTVFEQKLEAERHCATWTEIIAKAEKTNLRLKKEMREMQDVVRTQKRQIEDLKTELTRQTEDLKDASLQHDAAKDLEISNLKHAVVEKNAKIAGLIAMHEREIALLNSSVDDRIRDGREKMKSTIITALNNYCSEPESASVQLTQVSLCKQEEKPGLHLCKPETQFEDGQLEDGVNHRGRP